MPRLIYLTLVFLTLATIGFAANSYAGKFPKCFVGSYLIDETGGTTSLWTLGAKGTIIATSSSQDDLNFSTEHGSWQKSGKRQAKTTMLDFSFGDEGQLINIARVDATINFSGTKCDEIDGEFVLRFFDPGQDPLNINNSNGEPITDTFTGRRINPD